MSTLVKVLVSLGLVLPLGAFVAGSIAASGADAPQPRETIVIRDSPTGSASPHADRTPSDGPSVDDHEGPEVVTPTLDDLGDDHGGDRDGGDHSGRGGGDDHGDDSGGSHGSDDSGGGGHGSDDSGGGGHD